MAKISDVPSEYRQHARIVGADLLEQLSPAELKLRCQHAQDLADAAARSAIGEHSRFLNARKRAVLRSKPALDFIERDRELGHLAADAPRTISYDDRGKAISVAGAYEEVRRAHRDQNSYPPGLLAALDQAILGKKPGDPKLAEVTEAILAEAAAA